MLKKTNCQVKLSRILVRIRRLLSTFSRTTVIKLAKCRTSLIKRLWRHRSRRISPWSTWWIYITCGKCNNCSNLTPKPSNYSCNTCRGNKRALHYPIKAAVNKRTTKPFSNTSNWWTLQQLTKWCHKWWHQMAWAWTCRLTRAPRSCNRKACRTCQITTNKCSSYSSGPCSKRIVSICRLGHKHRCLAGILICSTRKLQGLKLVLRFNRVGLLVGMMRLLGSLWGTHLKIRLRSISHCLLALIFRMRIRQRTQPDSAHLKTCNQDCSTSSLREAPSKLTRCTTACLPRLRRRQPWRPSQPRPTLA